MHKVFDPISKISAITKDIKFHEDYPGGLHFGLAVSSTLMDFPLPVIPILVPCPGPTIANQQCRVLMSREDRLPDLRGLRIHQMSDGRSVRRGSFHFQPIRIRSDRSRSPQRQLLPLAEETEMMSSKRIVFELLHIILETLTP